MLDLTLPAQGPRPHKKKGSFSGGLNTSSPISQISDNEACDLDNCYSNEFGKLTKRLGCRSMGDAGGIVKGMYFFVVSAGTEKMIANVAGVLKKMDAASGLWDLTFDTVNWATAMANDYMHFATFVSGAAGTLVMTDESRSAPQSWDGSAAATLDMAAAPAGKYCVAWKNRVWIANTAANPDRIAWTDKDTLSTWSGGSSGTDDFIDEDVGITGLNIMGDNLYVFKKHSIWRVTWLGTKPYISKKQMINGIGTESPKTIQNVLKPGLGGEVMIFLDSNQRLIMCDGYDYRILSDIVQGSNGISSYYFNNINNNDTGTRILNRCHAIIDPDKKWYRLFVALSTDTYPKHEIVYDYEGNAFYGFSSRTFSSSLYCKNGRASGDNNREFPYAAYYNAPTAGMVYKLDQETADFTTSSPGTAIASYWISGRLSRAKPMTVKQIRKLFMEMKNVGAYDLTVQYRLNDDSDWIDFDESPITIDSEHHYLDISTQATWFQFKVSDSTITAGYEIWSIQILEDEEAIEA